MIRLPISFLPEVGLKIGLNGNFNYYQILFRMNLDEK